MLNFITNLSLGVLFIRSQWSIFTLFQLPKAISCNCIKATVSTNHSSSLAWHTEHPWSGAIAVYKSLGLYILVSFQIPSTLSTFTVSLTSATSPPTIFTPPEPRSSLRLDPVVPDLYSIFVCRDGCTRVKACSGWWWNICTYTCLLKSHMYST